MNSPTKMLQMQMQIKENAAELSDYLRDLDTWETDIKKQDNTFTKMKPMQEQKLSAPVRGSSVAKKKKSADGYESEKSKRIKSYDFKSWDKLDVEQMLDDIDAKEEEIEVRKQAEIERNFQKLSLDEKNKGNDHFKAARYEKSIECYTKGMQYDVTNPVLPANRAMAYLKLKRFVESEADCTLSLSLDPAYVKAYLRRGAARNALGKVESAIRDFNDVLKLEPDNKQAKQELHNVKKQTKPVSNETVDSNFLKPAEKKSGLIMPINKPSHLRSKKPLRRIHVEEIGRADVESGSGSRHELVTSAAREPLTNVSSDYKSHEKFPKSNSSIMELDEKSSNSTFLNNLHPNATSQHEDVAKLPIVESNLHSLNNGGPCVPPPPSTCFQLQADVRKLEKNSDLLFQYLFQLKPSSIPSLLKDQLDTALLLHVIKCFNKYATRNIQFVHEFLQNLSQAKRFDMAVLFLSNKDKEVMESLCQQLIARCPTKQEDIINLFKLYGLRWH